MITEVLPTLRAVAPSLIGSARASVACVATTRPKYLVFTERDSAKPLCIVEWGEPVPTLKTSTILQRLNRAIPQLVARVVYCGRCEDGRQVLVQSGLPGVPWFRVGDGITTAEGWRTLLDRAAAALGQLHEAVRSVPEWRGSIDLAAEMRRQMEELERRGVAIPGVARERVEEWSAAAGVPIEGAWQHGDFSFNNLLVAEDSIGIIDFDEFGMTMAPLHDAFGLALSLGLSQPNAPLGRAECIRRCVEAARERERLEYGQVPAAFMHHLLWRLNQCVPHPRREPLARILLRWVGEFAADPDGFLGRPSGS